jgi:hypothetical protein
MQLTYFLFQINLETDFYKYFQIKDYLLYHVFLLKKHSFQKFVFNFYQHNIAFTLKLFKN